jgi:hypothetical protein
MVPSPPPVQWRHPSPFCTAPIPPWPPPPPRSSPRQTFSTSDSETCLTDSFGLVEEKTTRMWAVLRRSRRALMRSRVSVLELIKKIQALAAWACNDDFCRIGLPSQSTPSPYQPKKLFGPRVSLIHSRQPQLPSAASSSLASRRLARRPPQGIPDRVTTTPRGATRKMGWKAAQKLIQHWKILRGDNVILSFPPLHTPHSSLSPLQDLQFTPCFLLPGDDHQRQG